jgi:hypothetical protein
MSHLTCFSTSRSQRSKMRKFKFWPLWPWKVGQIEKSYDILCSPIRCTYDKKFGEDTVNIKGVITFLCFVGYFRLLKLKPYSQILLQVLKKCLCQKCCSTINQPSLMSLLTVPDSKNQCSEVSTMALAISFNVFSWICWQQTSVQGAMF